MMHKRLLITVSLLFGVSLFSLLAYTRQTINLSKKQSQAELSVFSGVKIPESTIGGTGGGVLYSEQLDRFKSEVSDTISSKSGFVKNVSADYVIAGTLTKVDKIQTDLGQGYEFTLKDLSGAISTESISAQEAQYMTFFNETLDLSGNIKTLKTIDDVKQGDYVAIRKSFNLLNPTEVGIQFILVRQGD